MVEGESRFDNFGRRRLNLIFITTAKRNCFGKMTDNIQKVLLNNNFVSKARSLSKTKTSAQIEDLTVFVRKLSVQIDAKFSSLDDRPGRLRVLVDNSQVKNLKIIKMSTMSKGRLFIRMMTLRLCVVH